MSKQANERAFEMHVEEVLLQQGGWQSGTNSEWNVERAVFPARVCQFLETTQPTLWAEMRGLHAAGLEKLVVGTLAKELDLKGALHVLRHGFKFYGKTFRLAYFKPAHRLNEDVLALYDRNYLSITRQVLCHPGKHDTVDLLFAVNGLPVATCELKNTGTGQNWRHAVRQYEKDRESAGAFVRFSRVARWCILPPIRTRCTWRRACAARTRTSCPSTAGSHPGEVQCGAGNPQHPSG